MSTLSTRTGNDWFRLTNGPDRYGPYPGRMTTIAVIDVDQERIATDEEIIETLDLDPDDFASWPVSAQDFARQIVDHAIHDLARAVSTAAMETAEAVTRYVSATGDDVTVTNPEEVSAAAVHAADLGAARHVEQDHLVYRRPRDHRLPQPVPARRLRVPVEPPMPAGELVTVREALGLTREALAAALDVSLSSVESWELGRRVIPDGVRVDVQDLEAWTVAVATRLAGQLVVQDEPTVVVYRADRDLPDLDLPPASGAARLTPTARWWRAVAYRAAETVPGTRITEAAQRP